LRLHYHEFAQNALVEKRFSPRGPELSPATSPPALDGPKPRSGPFAAWFPKTRFHRLAARTRSRSCHRPRLSRWHRQRHNPPRHAAKQPPRQI